MEVGYESKRHGHIVIKISHKTSQVSAQANTVNLKTVKRMLVMHLQGFPTMPCAASFASVTNYITRIYWDRGLLRQSQKPNPQLPF
jgi:hypothetical protein